MSAFTFLSWARAGISASLKPPAGTVDAASASAQVTVGVTISTDSAGTSNASATVRLLGPGDITGLDPRQIVRSDPPNGTPAYPPNLFACVELDRPDLPWAFTPVGENGEKLQPWLVLVVVPADAAELSTPTATSPAMLKADATQLPPLADAWAWAHVAAAVPKASLGDVNELQRTNYEQVVSRLMCARALVPLTDYVACVVPSFLAGVQAGFGGPVSATTLAPAWNSTVPGSVTLPVYHSFRFRTGEGGDFRSLALTMKRRVLPAEASTRPVDISHPGAGVPDTPAATTIGLEGALRVPGAASGPWPNAARTPFQAALTPLLDAGAKPGPAGGHVLAPPLYGRWLAAHPTVPQGTGAAGRPVWLRTLNLDPRQRMVSGIAARTVQRHSQTLLAQAWAQIDEVNAANALLRAAQLARTRAASAWARLGALDGAVLVSLAGPALARTRLRRRTGRGVVAASSYPAGLLSGAARRLGRPRGPLGRRLGVTPGGAVRAGANPAATALKGAPAPWAVWPGRRTRGQITGAPVRDGFVPLSAKDPPPDARGRPVPTGDPLTEALRNAAATIATDRANLLKVADGRPPLDLDGLATDVLGALNPEQTVAARIASRVAVPARAPGVDPLDPVLAVPKFPQPMWTTLDETSRELLFPGLARIPRETVTALETNPRFVEAFLVGLNHELGAQLLFAEYPTDQRGTGFRQFWDARGRVPAPADPDDAHDIDAISDWPKANDLGESMRGAGPGNVVLVLRGEFLRRYPDVTVYALPATTVTPRPRALDPDPAHERYPQFTGRLGDVGFYGFDMTADDARGSEADGRPGYYFVLQQHPTAPHFGLLAAATGDAGAQPAEWDEVSWGNLTPAAADTPPRYAPLTVAWFAGFTWAPHPAWGADAASMAALCLQHPVRVAIHAEDLLPA